MWQLPADLEQRTADDWLASIGQSSQTRSLVWNPLARWLTGNDLVHDVRRCLRTLDETRIPEYSSR